MKDRLIFLAAALESIEWIENYTEGYCLDDFLADRRTQDAVIRNLEIIGQALKDFSIEKLLMVSSNIPWREIAGMRNILAHEYLGVDVVMVWDTVKVHLTPLKQTLESLMEQDF